MLGQRAGRAGDSQGDRVAQRAPIAGGFQAQRIGVGHAVAAIELEGDLVERAAVVNRSAAAPRNGRSPMRQLMEERHALVQLVVPRADGDDPVVTPRHTRRVLGGTAPP